MHFFSSYMLLEPNFCLSDVGQFEKTILLVGVPDPEHVHEASCTCSMLHKTVRNAILACKS